MSYVDTLYEYKHALSSGYTEDQAIFLAESAARSHNLTIDNLVTKDSFKATIDTLVTKEYFHQEMNVIRQEFTILKQEFKGLRWAVFGVGAILLIPVVDHYIRLITLFFAK
jgi:hypothetical protein